MSLRTLLLGTLGATLPCVPLFAQVDASAFLGAVHARYADSLDGTAGSLSGRLRFTSPSTWAGLDLGFTQFTTGEWAGQAQGGVVGLRHVSAGLALGVRGQVDGNYLQGGIWSGVASAGPVLAANTGGWSISLAPSVGLVHHTADSSTSYGAGWLQVRRHAGVVSLDAGAVGTVTSGARFVDATAGVGVRVPHLFAGALLGVRTGDLSGDPWAQAHVEWSPRPPFSIEAAAGTYPRDLTGFTSGFFATVGIRISRSRPTTDWTAPAPSVRLHRVDDAGVRVTISQPGAESVAIAGEWNQWTPEPLQPASGGRWTGLVPVAPGVYRFSLVIDGEDWRVPEGIPAVSDGFGGTVGLLVVK